MKFFKNLSFGVSLALLAFILAFAIITYGPRRYVVSHYHSPNDAVWNDQSLFLTVQSGGFARSEMKGASHVPILAAMFGLASGNEFVTLPGELTVFQYQSGQVQKDKITASVVETVPYGNTLYFVATGRSREKKVWQWQDTKLVEVTGDDAEQAAKAADAQPDNEDDQAPTPQLPEGWHRSSLYPGRSGTREIPVQLQASNAVIKITPPPTNVKAHEFQLALVTLEASDLQSPVTISGTEATGQQEITAAQFAALRSQDTTVHTRRNPSRSAIALSEYLIYLLLPFTPAIIALISLLRVKSKLLANLPENASFPNASPEQFTALNRNRLEELTRDVENLGFKRLLDYTMVSSMALPIPAFGRLFVNERTTCFAELTQVFPARGKPSELSCNFTTQFDGGWAVSTGTRKPIGGGWVLRLPKSVWRCVLGADPVSLLQAHQQQCTEISSALGLRVLPGMTASDYFPRVQNRMQQRRAVIKKKLLPVILFEYYSFKLSPRLEWKGDWPKEAANRSGMYAKAARA